MKLTKLFSLSLLTLVLVACAHTQSRKPQHYAQYPHPKLQQSQLHRIQQQGVNVYRVGQKITFRIPINNFFQQQSTRLKASRRAVVDSIAHYVSAYRISGSHARPVVQVYARAPANADQYAKVIAAYLWNAGVVATVKQVHGSGHHVVIKVF